MPPLPLTTLLRTVLPGLSAEARAVINTLASCNGAYPSAGDVAAIAGMRSRYQLARVLRREGLPPLVRLGGWARTLYWLIQAEGTGASLRQLAAGTGVPVATAYRLVHRVTGMPWSALQRAGLSAALANLRDHCPTRAGRVSGPWRSAGPGRAFAFRYPSGPYGVLSTPSSSPPDGARVRPARPHHPVGALAERFVMTGRPFDVACVGGELACVTRPHAAAVDQVTLSRPGFLGSVRTTSTPTRVAVCPGGSYAYVTNQFTEEIGILDLERHRQVGAIDVPGQALGAALAPDGRTLFVTTNLDRLCVVSMSRRKIEAAVSVPQVCTELALDRSGRRLYLPTWRAGRILEIDAGTLETLRALEVGGTVQDVAVCADGRTLFAANEAGWVDVFELRGGQRRARVELGTAAFGLALSPDEVVLYVTLLRAGKVAVIDRHTLAVTGMLATGGTPRRVAFDGSGSAALIANEAGWVDLVR